VFAPGRVRVQHVVRVLAPFGAFALEGWPALVGAALVQEGGLWLARRIAQPRDRTFTANLFLVAYVARLAIVLPTHYIAKLSNGNGALYPDNYTNDLVAEWLVRIARGEGATAIFPGHQYLLDSVYTYLLMAIYAVFGYAPLVPKLLNVSLAALSAVLVFEISRKIFNRRVAVVAAVAAGFLPSMVVWSIAAIKETLVLFTSLVALWVLQFLSDADRRDRRVADGLVLLLGATLLLLDVRETSALIVVLLLAAIGIGRLHLRLRAWQMALAGVAVAGLLVGGLLVMRDRGNNRPLSATFEDIALQIRHRRAQEAAGAGSQLRPDAQLQTDTVPQIPAAEASSDARPFSFVSDVVDPLGYALFAPAPWQAGSSLELAASAEMLVWDALLVVSLLALRARPRQPLFAACLLAYGVANWLILAAVEGNVGNLLRHRLMVDPVLIIFGAAGLVWLWPRLHVRYRSR
jgi:4-amino-4-deoxy-L-arabinose transferase-like glycosyltransferase